MRGVKGMLKAFAKVAYIAAGCAAAWAAARLTVVGAIALAGVLGTL